MSDCDHVIWLERFEPADGSRKYWLIHSASDADGGKVPDQIPDDHIICKFCPMCGKPNELA